MNVFEFNPISVPIRYNVCFFTGVDLDCERKPGKKEKKGILGKIINKSKLIRITESITVVKNPRTIYEPWVLSSKLTKEMFCHKCGCKSFYSSGNHVGYPEFWCEVFCDRCSTLIASADNSIFGLEIFR